MSKKKLCILWVFLGLVGNMVAQNSYSLFCINVTPHFDAEWVVDRIDSILQECSTDAFTVYYTMGYLASDTEVYYNALEISDLTKWEKNREKLTQIKPDSIVRDANMATPTSIDLEILLAKHYEEDGSDGMDNTSDIYVYWFADRELYLNKDCGLPLIKETYLKCNGNSTWKLLQLMNNNGSLLDLELSIFSKIKTDNIQVNNKRK